MITKKLKNNSGFTLTELLCAIAIISLLTACLTLGMGIGTKAMGSITKTAGSQSLGEAINSLVADELHYAYDINGSSNPSYSSTTYGQGIKDGVTKKYTGVKLELDGSGHIVVNTRNSDDPYNPYNLVSDEAYGSNMKITNFNYSYDSNKFTVTYNIVDNSGTTLYEGNFDVKPMIKTEVKS